MKIFKKDNDIKNGKKSNGRSFDGSRRENKSNGRSFTGKREEGPVGRNFGPKREDGSPMYKAVCGECGKNCEVPFKPNGKKTILCSFCFAKSGNSKVEIFKSGISVNQFEVANEKLDRILKLLTSCQNKK